MLSSKLEVAKYAVLQAAKVCQRIQAQVTPAMLEKKDNSPVTLADYACQALVSTLLREAFADIPLVGEEDASALREPANAALKESVVQEVAQSLSDPIREQSVLAAIDYGNYDPSTHADGRGFWTLDPIDGTKGFLRGEQYAIALAYIEQGEVKLGVLGCPNLQLLDTAGSLLWATQGQGAHMCDLEQKHLRPLSTDLIRVPAEARFCESVESGHSNHHDAARIAKDLGMTKNPVRLDSQAKYAIVASGRASVYLRLPTKRGYEEKIWDHAAGMHLIEEAGGKVTDVNGQSLDFSQGRTLANNLGVIATNGFLHDQVIESVRKILSESRSDA